MKRIGVYFVLIYLLNSCNGGVSFKKDLLTGLTTAGVGLMCEDVKIYANEKVFTSKEITYGEKITVKFNDIKGFKMLNGKVFPGMKIIVMNSKGDTVLFDPDLYKSTKDGYSQDPLMLNAYLTIANPIKSKNHYKAEIYIWDKKSTGKFTAKYDFEVIPNKAIKTESKGSKFDEIYLFSLQNKKIITDNIIDNDDKIYFFLDGLSGFYSEDGKVYPGAKMKITDANHKSILDLEDLFDTYSENGINLSDFNKQIALSFTLNKVALKNPIHIDIKIWDKKSDAYLQLNTDCMVK